MTQLTERFDEALVYARRLHAGQQRKGTEIPYVSHLLGVASLVLEAGGDEDEAIAALLHDAVEDQGGEPTLGEIRQRFGPRVADIVAGCTDAWEEPKPPWRERKEAYIEHLEEASPSVLLVSCADKLHNVRSIIADHLEIGDAVWERFSADPDDIIWYYQTLADRFEDLASDPRTRRLLALLDSELAELEALMVAEEEIGANWPENDETGAEAWLDDDEADKAWPGEEEADYAGMDRVIADAIRGVEEAERQPVRSRKIGRNEPCPCGSGKKYKKCCGARVH